jgi:hypothetical protein
MSERKSRGRYCQGAKCPSASGLCADRTQDFGIDSSATSLSAAALDQFVRPVTYQSLRDERLALALQAATPGAFRRINGLPQRPGRRHEPPLAHKCVYQSRRRTLRL